MLYERQEIERKLKEILLSNCEVRKNEIEDTDRLEYELELDSMSRFDLQFYIEQEFEIPQDETDGKLTPDLSFSELVELIYELIF